jgi:hypothetical protein
MAESIESASKRLELRDQVAQGAAVIGRLPHSQALSEVSLWGTLAQRHLRRRAR